MNREALKLALEALEPLVRRAAPWGELDWLNGCKAIAAIKEALAQQEPVAVYDYCPQCGAKGVMRERRPNGNDKCANGHTYPSSTSTPPQRTWVGLTDDNGGKTGWPPGLLQDDHSGLSRWLASKPDARQKVREALVQRTWVGLTDEEISYIAFEAGDEESAIYLAMDLLKEKNS